MRGSGLRTTALPEASAGATERMARICGKLNGEMTPTTPAGSRRAMLRRGMAVRSSWPYGASAVAAPVWYSPATRPASNAALP